MKFSGYIYIYITGIGLIVGIIFDILLYGLLVGASFGGLVQYWVSNLNKKNRKD